MTIHEQYMYRCLELAKKGAGHVAPNPMVGAVLVQDGKIISEGWHEKFGGPHAEVNCLTGQAIGRDATLSGSRMGDLNDATLYVSLEPCSHFGKTPPCTDLIIKHKIPKVVIGCRDPFKEVDGKGIEKLKAAGVEVELGILDRECKELNKRFFTFHTQHRPYVILKWAQTKDGFLATSSNPSEGGALVASKDSEFLIPADSELPPSGGFRGGSRLLISNEYSNRLVHQWRSEEASILVGTNTALNDDPELTTRLWPGNSPLRLVVDMELKLPNSLRLFNDKVITIVFNRIKHEMEHLTPFPSGRAGVGYYQITEDVSLVHQMLNALYQLKIQSVLVEGGARLLQSFIDEGVWDEMRVIVNGQLAIGNGLAAPDLNGAVRYNEQQLLNDSIGYYKRKQANDQ